jgi:hypothetical protein
VEDVAMTLNTRLKKNSAIFGVRMAVCFREMSDQIFAISTYVKEQKNF